MGVGPSNSPSPSLVKSQVPEPINRFLVSLILNSHSLPPTPPTKHALREEEEEEKEKEKEEAGELFS